MYLVLYRLLLQTRHHRHTKISIAHQQNKRNHRLQEQQQQRHEQFKNNHYENQQRHHQHNYDDITHDDQYNGIDDAFKDMIAEVDEENEQIESDIPMVEIDINKCPQGCVCQYARFMDLPISRWINYMNQKRESVRSANKESLSADDLLDENESSSYEGDLSYHSNPFIKQATCIIQDHTNLESLVQALPHDIRALILLYTGVSQNKTVNASILKPLNRLNTLEIRGSDQGGIRFILDTSLNFIQHANFEFITLFGSDTYKRPQNTVHPKDIFDYKPNIELMNDFDFSSNVNKGRDDQTFLVDLQQKTERHELEIIPYEVYREEVKKARMPIFYGWQRLEVLRIHSCGFRDLSWEMFLGLDNLQHLSLERNEIVELQPFSLSGATQLKTLSLAYNLIKNLHYRDLAGLFKLQVLDLSANRLSKLTELSFPPLPNLQSIDFRDNPIRYIFPAAFWIMNRTQEMFFGSKEVPLELWSNIPFKALHHLKALHIYNVTVDSLDQNIFKDLLSLEVLKLHGEIRSVEFDAFSDLSNLRELDISNCQLREISMDALMGCKYLHIINLGYNNLSYIPPGLFDDQLSLEEIYLNNNQLKFLPNSLFQHRKLKLLRLNNNPWKCNCEMSSWKAKITNQEKGLNTERCINDYLTGKKLSCRKIDGYKFNHKYAPRCENYKGRSVYYVLRKQIECGPIKIMHLRRNGTTVQRIPHWRKMQERRQLYKDRLNNKNANSNLLLWRLEKTRNNDFKKFVDQQATSYNHAQSNKPIAAENAIITTTIASTYEGEISNDI
uniref:LRRCT domain-containing protein n=1 Tax=Glossina brevipalpis TaxID=37001 RepID=A0A1A9W5K1_9MUSC